MTDPADKRFPRALTSPYPIPEIQCRAAVVGPYRRVQATNRMRASICTIQLPRNLVMLTIGFLFTRSTTAAATRLQVHGDGLLAVGGWGRFRGGSEASSNRCVNFCEFSARPRS